MQRTLLFALISSTVLVGCHRAATRPSEAEAAAADAAARVGGERGLLPSDLFPHLRRMANPA